MQSETLLVWLSFSADDGFRGACVVEGFDTRSAIEEAHRLGINPGGEVMALPVPPGCESRLPLNTLMSRDEIERLDGAPPVSTLRASDDDTETIFTHAELVCEHHNALGSLSTPSST
jgi:hypothetical protein